MKEEKIPALSIQNLSVTLVRRGVRRMAVQHSEVRHSEVRHSEIRQMAVRDVSLTVEKGRCTGIIGESGCGKSLTCQALFGLLDKKTWELQGQVFLGNEQLPLENDRKMDAYRGRKMGFIVQNPMAALDPRMKIGAFFCENISRKERPARLAQAEQLLARMHIQQPSEVLKAYPFQLSGGMLQRILIALAISSHPQILIADEPTTALDSTTQYEILHIFSQLQQEENIALLLVSHDLDVIDRLADVIYVMYAGQIIEYGPKETLLRRPLHPYTCGLFQSRSSFSKERLKTMEGRPPRLSEMDRPGCPFYPRCANADAGCLKEDPPLCEWEPKHWSRCRRGVWEHGTVAGSM